MNLKPDKSKWDASLRWHDKFYLGRVRFKEAISGMMALLYNDQAPLTTRAVIASDHLGARQSSTQSRHLPMVESFGAVLPRGLKEAPRNDDGALFFQKGIGLGVALLVLVGVFLAAPAYALSSPTVADESMSVRLLSETEALGDGQNLLLGLEVALEDGVHTYWRSPGMAGTPPALDWSKSSNLKDATLLYPTPQRKSLFGIDTIGYTQHVTFPIRADALDATKPLELNLAVDLLVCKELCLPKHFDLALKIPNGPTQHGSDAAFLKESLDKVPTASSNALSITNVTSAADKVSVSITSTHPIETPDLFIEADPALTFAKPEVTRDTNGSGATLTSKLEGTLPEGKTLAEIPMTLTLTNGADALEQRLPQNASSLPQNEPLRAEPEPLNLPLWSVILLALCGGLILNLMPCVLPVLSLKILSVMKHGGNDHRRIRHSFLFAGAGILFSFVILASTTIALKAGGQAIGWGVQFQQPTFLVFMITLLTLFAANLWGFFEITLPRFVMDRLDATHHPKLAGDFATGILATLLATPCSAPFLGTAVGFALAAGWVEILLIFIALGLGMAAPYFAIALWPQVAAALPKPGKWMARLTQLLGFGLAGTAAWLLIVLHAQIGGTMTFVITGGMLAILGQLFLRHKNYLRALTVPMIALIFMGALGIGFVATLPEQLAHDSGVWEKFDEEALARHVREGNVVFVDITADWCITCKANKRFTLARDEITQRLFEDDRVIAMQGDWTNPDAALTAFLHKHGRYGIPFNIVFGPKAQGGILLPELLTPSAVIEALAHAKATDKACPVDLPKGLGC